MKKLLITMLLLVATQTPLWAVYQSPAIKTEPPPQKVTRFEEKVQKEQKKLLALREKKPAKFERKFERKIKKALAIMTNPAKIARIEKAIRWSNSRQTDLGRLAGAVLIGLLTLTALAVFILEAMFATPISAVICILLIGAGVTATICCINN